MAKKLVSVWLSLTILLFSSISIYAEENVQGDFFIKNIVINGEEIINNHLQYPFFLYQNTTYFPLTSEMGKIFGFEAEMDYESRTLKLLKTEPTLKNISDRWKKNEKEDVVAQVLNETKVLAYELVNFEDPSKTNNDSTTDNSVLIDTEVTEDNEKNEVIKVPELSVQEIDLEGFPVLTKGKVLYLPLRIIASEKALDWDLYFDSYTGLFISTMEGIPAKSYWSEAESKYNQGLVNYIMRYNGNYTTSKAQELVFMFKQAGKANNIDEKILIAVAHKESTFNPSAKGRSGSLGIMQVMPATGKGYGLSTSQLLDAQNSIEFGAMYLSKKVADYNGDLVKAFSAYNQGNIPVNRGTHSTTYADRIIGTINGINSYLTSNGYGLGN